MKKLTVFLLLHIIISFSFSFAQDIPTTVIKDEDMKGYKKKKFFQIAALGGFINPLFILNDNYNASPSFGMDIGYRLNKETGLYIEGNYIMLSNKDSLSPPKAYMQFSLGSRFYFRAKGVRSSFFFEVGAGPYVFTQSSKVIDTISYESKTIGKLGLNAGIGCEMVLTNFMYVLVKSKYNYIIEDKVTKSYVSGSIGLMFRL